MLCVLMLLYYSNNNNIMSIPRAGLMGIRSRGKSLNLLHESPDLNWGLDNSWGESIYLLDSCKWFCKSSKTQVNLRSIPVLSLTFTSPPAHHHHHLLQPNTNVYSKPNLICFWNLVLQPPPTMYHYQPLCYIVFFNLLILIQPQILRPTLSATKVKHNFRTEAFTLSKHSLQLVYQRVFSSSSKLPWKTACEM